MKRLKRKFFILSMINALVSLPGLNKLQAQPQNDTSVCLVRFEVGGARAYKIPMTKYCFVQEAGINRDYSNGWIMKWDIVKKANSNLLFLEMNSSETENWPGNENINGSVQLVFELPAFTDSISLTALTHKSKGVYAINNYAGGGKSKEYVNGKLTVIRNSPHVIVNSLLNLVTENPETRQQFKLVNSPARSFTFEQYQEFENQRDSILEARTDAMVNALTAAIFLRDSLLALNENRVKDSLKAHPYTGKFRFWVSSVDKASYARTTYSINEDSLIIKKGPYDFIYLAKNYSKDSVYFRRALNQKEKTLLSELERRIETVTLETTYTNHCIIDGSILSFSFESAEFSKDVTTSNYYNENIAEIVKFVNKISPKVYQLWYDKQTLLKFQRECDN